MKTIEKTFSVSSRSRCEMIDITSRVQSAVDSSAVSAGDAIVYCPHTTAAVTINENADPSVVADLLLILAELVPANQSSYRHVEGNSDAHAKSSIIGCTEKVLLKNGSLVLGTWQGIYFCEFDGPRNRKVIVQIRGE